MSASFNPMWVLDPAGIFGGDQGGGGSSGGGSRIQGNLSGTAHDPSSDIMGRHAGDPGFSGSIDGSVPPPNPAAHDRAQGFIQNMGGWRPGLANGMNHGPQAPPPPSQWGYQPGGGVSWMDPTKRITADDQYQFDPSKKTFTGNRI
jgi:hypothetical protein